MLKDGDRVMVAVSGSSSSLCLLHLIRQFSRARGLHIILGAVTIGDASMDPRALMLYMRNLGVEYFYEQGKVSDAEHKVLIFLMLIHISKIHPMSPYVNVFVLLLVNASIMSSQLLHLSTNSLKTS